jgi:hypothetical protein
VSAPATSPFNPRVLLGMLLFGALAFIATLYFVGAGETGGDANNGEAHAAAKGLNGYAALAALLDRQGYRVTLSRSPKRLTDHALVVLTPPLGTNVNELNRVILERRYAGPTLVILPKWFAAKLPHRSGIKAEPGWVALLGSIAPKWAGDLMQDKALVPAAGKLGGNAGYWQGMALQGSLPDAGHVNWVRSDKLVPLVRDGADHTLAGYWDDNGLYPSLDAAAGVTQNEDEPNRNIWPVVIVAEPDLVNNYGLADRQRALLALALTDAAMMSHRDLPVVFDLTLDGLGGSRNLLTLAFSPPFLAATLCLILAALVIGWRGYRRFGPPFAAAPVFAFGKRQLAVNGAALIQRSRRLHLLAAPYAAMLRARIAAALGLRLADEAEIDRLLEIRGLGQHAFSRPAEALRGAHGATDLLRSAQALKQLERNVSS